MSPRNGRACGWRFRLRDHLEDPQSLKSSLLQRFRLNLEESRPVRDARVPPGMQAREPRNNTASEYPLDSSGSPGPRSRCSLRLPGDVGGVGKPAHCFRTGLTEHPKINAIEDHQNFPLFSCNLRIRITLRSLMIENWPRCLQPFAGKFFATENLNGPGPYCFGARMLELIGKLRIRGNGWRSDSSHALSLHPRIMRKSDSLEGAIS